MMWKEYQNELQLMGSNKKHTTTRFDKSGQKDQITWADTIKS